MVEFKNVAPLEYVYARMKVDDKIKELVHRYSYLECSDHYFTYYPNSLVEVGYYQKHFYYKLPLTCCRVFETQLFFMMQSESYCNLEPDEYWRKHSLFDKERI